MTIFIMKKISIYTYQLISVKNPKILFLILTLDLSSLENRENRNSFNSKCFQSAEQEVSLGCGMYCNTCCVWQEKRHVAEPIWQKRVPEKWVVVIWWLWNNWCEGGRWWVLKLNECAWIKFVGTVCRTWRAGRQKHKRLAFSASDFSEETTAMKGPSCFLWEIGYLTTALFPCPAPCLICLILIHWGKVKALKM